jgi:L-ornithine N5-oxygenase
VNEIFDPDRVDSFFSLPERQRSAALAADRATNYSVVRLDLIEAVYEVMYQQKLHNPDPATWAHRIIPLHEVHSVLETEAGKVSLQLSQVRDGEKGEGEEKISDEFDLVIFGTGYTRDMHRKLLTPVEGLFSGEKCTVDRRYRVVFKDEAVAREAGIWLQGCCEDTHGVS